MANEKKAHALRAQMMSEKSDIYSLSNSTLKQTHMLISALGYVRKLGLPVFPLVPRDKQPLTGHGFHDATCDEEMIKAWWDNWPEANIGMPTGQVSGIVALDVDPRHGGDESLRDLMTFHGSLPHTWEQLTGGGGRHILFKCPSPLVSRTGFRPGLDLKADGGYIVLAPSIHPCGLAYQWEMSSKPLSMPLAEMPPWYLDLVSDKRPAKATRIPSSEWQVLMQGVTEGGRNEAATRLIGHLLRHRVDSHLVLEFVKLWNMRNDPPLSNAEIISTFHSIAGAELRRRESRS